MVSVTEKFLKYVKFNTQSDEDTKVIPSSQGQFVFAKELYEELQNIGMKEVTLDGNGFVMATLPSNVNKNVPTIGFLAHLDTSPDFEGGNVKPNIIYNYDGNDIILNKDLGIILSPDSFKELKNHIGETLITTDGTTLLGADDKAGIAEIMEAMEYLIKHPEIPHGKIRIAFTPDEEIGDGGAAIFDVEKFGADFAYTIDGDAIGEFNYENFNAAGVIIKISGRSVHPGEAKDKMINALMLANEFINAIPQYETPEYTEGYEGFYHLLSLSGDVENANLEYMIRDFEMDSFNKRKNIMLSAAEKINKKYKDGNIEIEITDEYYNMKEKVISVKHIIDTALKAYESVGITPVIKPIRGGTDGSTISFKGLPTPNIFLGGYNYHGRYEFIPVKVMEKAAEIIIKIVELYAK